LQDLQLLFL